MTPSANDSGSRTLAIMAAMLTSGPTRWTGGIPPANTQVDFHAANWAVLPSIRGGQLFKVLGLRKGTMRLERAAEDGTSIHRGAAHQMRETDIAAHGWRLFADLADALSYLEL